MEVRGQDKDMVMPTPRRDQQQQTVHTNTTIFNNPSQTTTIDHHHPHNFYHHQLNSQHKPRRDPSPDQDPVPASIAATVSTTDTAATVAIASGSTFRSSQPPVLTTATTTTTTTAAATISIAAVRSVRYRECLKNHAASMGGHVVDGCGEFMPSGEDGTREALKCAACECHRNFHRKEIDGDRHLPHYYYPPYNNVNKTNNHQRSCTMAPTQVNITTSIPPLQHPSFHRHAYSPSNVPIAPVMMAFGGGGSAGGGGGASESSSEDLNMFQSNEGGHRSGQPKKRFRTKFTQEQKDKMMEFAEKIGWKIQKQDEQEVQQFCSQSGVKRQVFKVWMHNNKQSMKKKQM